MKTKKLTKETTIKEILELKGGEAILAKYNLPCLSCPMAALEIGTLTLERVTKIYRLPLAKILKELNSLS